MGGNSILGLAVIEAKASARVRWGIAWGLVFAAACCAVALFQLLLQGPAFFVARRITLPGILATYVLGCGAAGALVGLLVPLARTRAGSMVIGFVAVLPIGLAVQISTLDAPWKTMNTLIVLIGSLGIGIPAGVIYRDIFGAELSKQSNRT